MKKKYQAEQATADKFFSLLRFLTITLFLLGLSALQAGTGGDAEGVEQAPDRSGTGPADPIAITAEEQAWLDRKPRSGSASATPLPTIWPLPNRRVSPSIT